MGRGRCSDLVVSVLVSGSSGPGLSPGRGECVGSLGLCAYPTFFTLYVGGTLTKNTVYSLSRTVAFHALYHDLNNVVGVVYGLYKILGLRSVLIQS